MTLSRVTEELLEALRKSGGEHSSVRLARNAKGDTQIEVVVRTGEESHLGTIADAVAQARTIYDELRVAYPMTENGSDA
jgi:hypothetical protein